MGQSRCILFALLGLLLVVSAFAAPKEGDAANEADSTESKKATTEPKKTAIEERNVLVSDETWNTWLSGSTYTIATASIGVLFLLAGVGVGVYYYYYVTAVDLNAATNGVPYSYNNQAYNNYQAYQTGRALDTDPGSRWNFTKVLEYIEIAQRTYEGFEWQNLDCQKRVLCELSQKDNWAGETGRKITNDYLLTMVDAVSGIPFPQMITALLNEYKAAISQGKNSTKECGGVYTKCKFSIKEVIAAAGQKRKSNKF